ncbi:PIN domain-containing protein [Ruania sp. N2-46]|uniref:Ribonuclease VapC n=1 Tax=Occultella gossypii TaxID=2800820 RepID=A0ABS7S806_9MICO|nr:PIN domain-containing protein [Occultella gossypii]
MPAVLRWHEFHTPARAALSEIVAVPAHVIVEAYSVLTRLPAPHRLSARSASELLGALPFPIVGLAPERHQSLVAELASRGVKGGAVYDGVVAATAAEHGLRLVSLDRRASSTYDAVGVQVRRL